MSLVHKIVKALAIVFAVFILALVVDTFVFIASGPGDVPKQKETKDKKSDDANENEKALPGASKSFSGISELEISLAANHVKIVKGDSLRVVGDDLDEYFKFEKEGDTLKISSRKTGKFIGLGSKPRNLTIYVDSLDELDIESGAGMVSVDGIELNKLEAEQGAGEFKLINLDLASCEIDGGAGKITIKDSKIRNLSVESGIGNIEISGDIYGETDIDSGVGNIKLNLTRAKEEYRFEIDKGFGNVRIDNENINNDTNYGNGTNKIDIDGGVGNIDISFNN